MPEDTVEAEKSSTPADAASAPAPTTASDGKTEAAAESLPVGKTEEEPEADEDPSTRQISKALEALRARRAELREANAEIDTLREQLLKAQGDAESEREEKEFARSERELLEKAKAAYAADLEVLKTQLGAARTTIEEERAAKTSLRTDISRLQSQLSALCDGLKKIQARCSTSTAELEETKKAKAQLTSELEELKAKHAAAAEVEAQLTATKSELQEQKALVSSLQRELEEKKKAAGSAAAALEALQVQLNDAREELGRGKEARLLLMGELRSELETKMENAFHEVCKDLDQAPHRTLCTGPSALRQRRPRPSAGADNAGTRVRFSPDESMVTGVGVTSFRDTSDLWFTKPDENVECERCQSRCPKALGFMKKIPGLSELARQEFLCAECNRADAVEGKRREELKALDTQRNDEMRSFFPTSSPTGQAGEASAEHIESSSESYSDSDSSLPCSESPPCSESSGGGYGRNSLRKARSADGLELGPRGKRRKA